MILFSGFSKILFFGVISFNPDRGHKKTFNFRKKYRPDWFSRSLDPNCNKQTDKASICRYISKAKSGQFSSSCSQG